MTEQISYFEHLQELLQKVSFASQLLAATPEKPFEQLLVLLTGEENKTDRKPLVVTLSFLQDVLELEDALDEQEQSVVLQYSILFFLAPPKASVFEFSYFLAKLNHMIPIGSFVLGEDEQIFYRYQYMSETRDVSPVIVVDTLNIIEHIAQTLEPEFIAYLAGEKTCNAILSQFQN